MGPTKFSTRIWVLTTVVLGFTVVWYPYEVLPPVIDDMTRLAAVMAGMLALGLALPLMAPDQPRILWPLATVTGLAAARLFGLHHVDTSSSTVVVSYLVEGIGVHGVLGFALTWLGVLLAGR
jgi:hypothetical protein